MRFQCIKSATVVAYAGLRVKPGTCQPQAGMDLVLKITRLLCVYACVGGCIPLPPRLLITSGVIWPPCDLLTSSTTFTWQL